MKTPARAGHVSVDWRYLVAVGCVAGDLSPAAIARHAGVHVADAEQALGDARADGVMSDDGAIDDLTRLRLIDDLPKDIQSAVHASVARRLFAAGPEHFVDALAHARSAGTLVGVEEILSMADHGGQMSLSVGDYAVARRLLELGVELDTSTDLSAQGNRLCDLAAALDGLGDVPAARAHLLRAVALGELAGDVALMVRAAVQHALPADWYTGDAHATGLLQRVEEHPLTADERRRLHAARAFTENRIPLVGDDGQQLAWVTRAAVAQRFANDALCGSETSSPSDRLFALLAWRTTHRAPHHLERRREVASEALDLAQRLRIAPLQVEAAVMLAVDALESGDRALFDQSLAVARWVAQRDGNPRLLWRAYTLAAGGAHLDGDVDDARRYRELAREVGEPIGTPGWLGAEFLLIGEEVISADDFESMRLYLFDESFPGLANPIGRSCIAYLFARHGDLATAERYVRRAVRQLDDEASYLLLCTRMADAAALIGNRDLILELINRLTPWSHHVSVDSHAWWCDGPVALWLATLHQRLGDDGAAMQFLERGEPIARAMNDVRSMRRAAQLREQITPVGYEPTDSPLTDREVEVLRLLAQGCTNPEIAQRLAFSVSTIRMDTMAIYRKLDVKGRTEAVSRATSLGMLRLP